MNTNAFLSLQFVRNIVLKLPEVTEKLCFETPAFYAGKKIFARLREDGETWAIYTEERDKWMAAQPEVFFITDHYVNYKYMLIDLQKVDPKDFEELLIAAWRKRSLKRAIGEYDELGR